MKINFIIDNKLLRFSIIGAINTIIGSVIMFSLYNVAQLSYWISSASNYFITSILSFFMNKYFTFGIKQWSVLMIFLFILTILCSYLIAYGIAKPVTSYLLMNSSIKIRENIALFTGMCLFTLFNYLGQRFIVFKNKKADV
ncbi:MAG: GtrA family protein [Treponema sp.]|nr:GtrA family protein [Treponema sp.]